MYVKYITWKYLQLLKVLIGVISTPFASKTLIKDSFKMLTQEIGAMRHLRYDLYFLQRLYNARGKPITCPNIIIQMCVNENNCIVTEYI